MDRSPPFKAIPTRECKEYQLTAILPPNGIPIRCRIMFSYKYIIKRGDWYIRSILYSVMKQYVILRIGHRMKRAV